MGRKPGRSSQLPLALSLIFAGTLGLIFIPVPGPSGSTGAAQSNFMGGSPSILDLEGLVTLRLQFPAGVRANWHTHNNGQLLMVESGRGLHQVRGGPVEVKLPGEPWFTPGGVEHWHGAHPEEDVFQWTIYDGNVNWMDPVTDEQYRVPPGN